MRLTIIIIIIIKKKKKKKKKRKKKKGKEVNSESIILFLRTKPKAYRDSFFFPLSFFSALFAGNDFFVCLFVVV